LVRTISVLCVDDESASRELCKRYLERTNEFAVTTASSAPEALHLLQSNGIQAIVSDYLMPGMDGIAFLKQVRATNPDIPFIMFTGKGWEAIAIEAFESGADFYLQKGGIGTPSSSYADLMYKIKMAIEQRRVDRALVDSELQYRRLFETAQDAILILDGETGEVIDANKFILDMLGYPLEYFIGKHLWELGFIKDKTIAQNAFTELKTKGYIRYEDLPLETKDRRSIDVEFISNAYSVGVKKIIQCNIRNITDRKVIQDALQVSELQYRRLFETAQDGILILDGETGEVIDANKFILDMLGYSRDYFIGKHLWELGFIKDKTIAQNAFTELKTKGYIRYEDLPLETKDRRSIDVEFISNAYSVGVKKIIQCNIRSITDRKQAEEKAYIRLVKYKVVFESVPLGITITDHAGNIVESNRMAEQLLGLPAQDPVSGTIDIREWQVVRPDGSPMPAEEYASTRALKENRLVAHIEMGVVRKEGTITWIDATAAPIPLEGYGVAIAYSDITRRKEAEKTIRAFSESLEREVAERTSDLTDTNQKLLAEIGIRIDAETQLTKTVGEKDVLLREVHHRVKNNLQIIISLLNLQSRYMTDATTLAAFRESQNRVKAMALVHEKLYQSSDLTKIDLDNYIRFLGDNLFQFFGASGRDIRFTREIRDIFLAIDTAIPLGLIINELISNALKYAFPGGRAGEISLAIHQAGHTLTILFSDNGVGIPGDFDWRNAKSLGLRLVCSLVEQLDGTIELDRTAGTAFTIVVKEKE